MHAMDFRTTTLHAPQTPPPPPPLPPPSSSPSPSPSHELIPLTLMLMETVGDSECGTSIYDQMRSHGLLRMSLVEEDGEEDHKEDIESSCGTYCYSHACLKEKFGERDVRQAVDDDDDDDDDADSLRRCSPVRLEKEEKKVVDSREEDRLFWEACLANRYPYN
ncbi:Formin homology 2 domain (FH2 domain)-containing protein [Dioscorea alata]|uniref:Formin homology 2 domain (FH2 domain)-containing protein n=1 Tax=Dioscorea alata TaxID=55571 RepID=A0ACB7V0Q0_DIOAL|nr:Formin homology 2 domain (FH2 domain)-containing protein [Dioscorea alata]